MELILSLCLLAAPAQCRDEVFALQDREGNAAPPLICVTQGQQIVAKWSSEHPDWQVKRWRCVPAGRERSA